MTNLAATHCTAKVQLFLLSLNVHYCANGSVGSQRSADAVWGQEEARAERGQRKTSEFCMSEIDFFTYRHTSAACNACNQFPSMEQKCISAKRLLLISRGGQRGQQAARFQPDIPGVFTAALELQPEIQHALSDVWSTATGVEQSQLTSREQRSRPGL